jgi:hypothetical protein
MHVPQSNHAAAVVVDRVYYPLHAMRCSGSPSYRTQAVRDFGCLLDVDDDVRTWRCGPVLDGPNGFEYRADFLVKRSASIQIVDVKSADRAMPGWVQEAILAGGYDYEIVDPSEYPVTRLQNAQDLLRYARYEVSLSDRVRLLAALDEHHTLTVAECLGAIQTAQPIAAVARLVLQRFIDVDLDDALIGPETVIRRRRD